ncbi:GtrA family protein [Peribacillus simplex]|uniref:Flippase GtrA (Transmembrane translocase of bactoprenol-linked glucose) n=1 Tax=Peribacillus simplex TaxID=1478 RepID=A0A9X8WK89_9BACI|nr:GtrA family protein [Peribacillus simplex]WHY57557.1 GtrA family protein [Peribacillus simplex]WHY98455.1 GtrA family protein [Peribacillus simplex]SIR04374.1 Putative flippase GtrA (transmembrane translocase of bactoprenol-linked glucose) [Peribacillus simplex]
MNGTVLKNYLKHTNSFIRFLLVGIVNTAVGLSIMLFLMNVLEFSYWVSTFIGNGTGAVTSFLLNRTFTFKSDIEWRRGVARFFCVILICYSAAYSLGQAIAESMEGSVHLPIQQNVAVLIGAIFYTVLNYIGQKYFVFKKSNLRPIQEGRN